MLYQIPRHEDIVTDVFIAGSGPIGATFAKKFVDAGYKVTMVEIGAADSFTSKPRLLSKGGSTGDEPFSVQFDPDQVIVPGYHKKNEIAFQKDIDKFVNVIKGALSTVSIPTSNNVVPTLDPLSFSNSTEKPFLSLAKNPAQDPFFNLGAEAVTRGVGGMSTHWTCATPRLNPYKELPHLVENEAENTKLWDKLYAEAEQIIGTSSKEFDESIRHNLVLQNLKKIYEKIDPKRVFKPLPLACHRLTDPRYVEWHATDRILEELFTDPTKAPRFRLMTNHRCTKLVMREVKKGEYIVDGAQVRCLLPQSEGRSELEPDFHVKAKTYIIACGAVATAQILANSQREVNPSTPNKPPVERIIETPWTPNVGKYITEQPLAFCQIVMNRSIIDSVDKNPYPQFKWWMPKVDEHMEKYPEDPIHIPFHDPEPQVTTPFTEKHPWHTQIHRDAFNYGAVAENIDTRLIVDFRFFSYVDPHEWNTMKFQESYEDAFGMPQATFKFSLDENDRERCRLMMADMCEMALKIGGYLPGSEPQFMDPGLTLHLAGTVRAGLKREETVADTFSKVWGFPNLYVGGNGVIPTGFGANPTLTSIGYAIRASDDIIRKLKSGEMH